MGWNQLLAFLERAHLVNAVREDSNVVTYADAGSVPALTPHLPARDHVPGDARALDAVYRALQILETSTRQLTIDVWRDGKPLDLFEQPSFLRRPSLALTSFGAFTAETVSSLAQRGNAYWLIFRDTKGKIVSVDVLDPRRVGVAFDTTRTQRLYTLDGKNVKPSHIMHLRLTHVPGEPYGLSPLEACRSEIQGALQTQEYGSTWTDTAGAPSGILSTDQVLSDDQAKRYKKQANEQMQYKNGITVLGSGLTYQKLLFTPAELQFLESQRDAVTKVARMFGIPAKMLLATVEGGSDTYSNAETENQQFARLTLMTYISEIEDALTALVPRGQSVRYNLDGLLRSDTKTRYEAHQIGINAGFLTINEVRAIEGLQPLAQPTPAAEEGQSDES
ncbi:MAG: phage portal protein [Actinomycetaceae bacterium]|nr:phage portal protein [Actinomycetaceae bacterium]MDY5854935.1 phage portal protein [Arcanobacterium sp.]